MTARGRVHPAALYAGGAALAVVAAFPLLWMLSTSLKPSGEVFATPPTLVPRHMTLGNFSRLLLDTPFPTYFQIGRASCRERV